MNNEKLRLIACISFNWIKNNYHDLIVIFLVPIILLLLSVFVPSSLQESLVLHHDSPVVYQFFTANFFHGSFSHLLNNSVNYLVTITLIYLAYSFGGRRDLFYLSFIVAIFVLPFFIKFFGLILFKQSFGSVGTSRGFSGINGAFIGILPYSIFYFVDNKFDLESSNAGNYAAGLFGLGFLITASHYAFYIYLSGSGFPFDGVLVNKGLLVFWGIIILILYFLFLRFKVNNILSGSSKFYVQYLFGSLLMFVYLVFSLFPSKLIVNGHLVNFITHWTGYLLGFIGIMAADNIWNQHIKEKLEHN